MRLTYPSGTTFQVYANPKQQKKAEELLKKCPQLIRNAYDKSTRRFAKIILQIVKESFMTGLPPIGSGVSWAPLAPRTIRSYNSWKYTGYHLYYLIGQMYHRVGIYQSRTKNREVRIGFPQGVRAIDPNPRQRSGSLKSRPTLNTLMAILEGGTNRIPPRPLFRPAFKAAGGAKRLTKFFIEDLRKELRKYIR